MAKVSILNKIAVPISDWDDLYRDTPELANAIHYLLVLEEMSGFGKADAKRSNKETNEVVAKELGISVATLAFKRRQWTKDGVLADARAWLQPLRLEQLQAMADRVENSFMDIMSKFLEVALDDKSDVYAKVAAWKVLKSDVIAPALSNAKAQDEGDSEYDAKMKELEASGDEPNDDEEYLRLSGE